MFWKRFLRRGSGMSRCYVDLTLAPQLVFSKKLSNMHRSFSSRTAKPAAVPAVYDRLRSRSEQVPGAGSGSRFRNEFRSEARLWSRFRSRARFQSSRARCREGLQQRTFHCQGIILTCQHSCWQFFMLTSCCHAARLRPHMSLHCQAVMSIHYDTPTCCHSAMLTCCHSDMLSL